MLKQTLVSVASIMLVNTLCMFSASAQSLPGGTQGIPRAADGKPNFMGVWAGPSFEHPDPPSDINPNAADCCLFDEKKMAPFTPLGEKRMFRKATGQVRLDNPPGVCLPGGLLLEILSPYAQQWLQGPGFVVIRYEYMNNASRVIPTDGRAHAKDIDPTWMGDSVGKWEGDTLVIDTVGLKEWVLDEYGHTFPNVGSRWHSDSLHVTERLKFTGPRRVSYQVTIDDPQYFVRPWSQEYKMTLQPTWKLLEYVCNENDRCPLGKCEGSDGQPGSH